MDEEVAYRYTTTDIEWSTVHVICSESISVAKDISWLHTQTSKQTLQQVWMF